MRSHPIAQLTAVALLTAVPVFAEDISAVVFDACRSKPEFFVYVPAEHTGRDAENQHFIVTPTPKGAFLAVWTQSSTENKPDQRIVVRRSTDRGRTWGEVVEIDGQTDGNGHRASWGFPVVTPGGRIYVFYNKNIGVQDVREDTTGEMRFKYSDDDGLTWKGPHTIPLPKVKRSHPDPKVPESWIVYQAPVVLDGQVIAPFTHWASSYHIKTSDLFQRDSRIHFIRFDNLLTETDPTRLRVSILPEDGEGIAVPRADKPEISVAQEATVARLSDGRWFAIFRTLRGSIWWSQSRDAGKTWAPAAELRYAPGGDVVKQPICPAPMYQLRDGRLVLIFHNNDGSANGGRGPADYTKNRSPAWITIGRERNPLPAGDEQPVTFDPPRVLMTNDLVPAGPIGRTELATYTSLFEYEGHAYFWYPDRKHYLLGRLLDDVLAQPAGR